MGASIQFKGKDAVVNAYTNRDVVAWCICQGKAMIFKFLPGENDTITEGAAQLESCLDMLVDSAAIYTLKIFEEPGERIRSNTPDDGAFNFRLTIAEEGSQGAYVRYPSQEILSELAAIKKRLDEREQEEEEEEEEDYNQKAITGTITGFLGNPAVQPVITSLLSTWLTKLLPDSEAGKSAAMALQKSVAGQGDILLNDAVSTLKSVDPLLGAHLTKLAKIATEKPAMYNVLLQMLNKDQQ
jgi:hypothetical protein